MSSIAGGPVDHTAHRPAARVHDPKKARRALMGAYVGTSLEWYDFFLFGTTSAIVFAPLFFGGDDPALATISSFLLFGVGFIARPVGALLAGHFGDRIGRRTILMITIVAMGVASTLIGLLPTYENAGLVAPILLGVFVSCRAWPPVVNGAVPRCWPWRTRLRTSVGSTDPWCSWVHPPAPFSPV